MPTIQKYGFPPKCIDLYPKDDIPIEATRCLYLAVITLKSLKVGHEVQKYAHFKMSRKMDKTYGYVALGLSKDDKMVSYLLLKFLTRKDKRVILFLFSGRRSHR